jgi:hypothetical protein
VLEEEEVIRENGRGVVLMTWMTVFCTLYLYTMEFSGGKPAWAFGKHQG